MEDADRLDGEEDFAEARESQWHDGLCAVMTQNMTPGSAPLAGVHPHSKPIVQ